MNLAVIDFIKEKTTKIKDDYLEVIKIVIKNNSP